jgi:SAM-dependent methyltransferase
MSKRGDITQNINNMHLEQSFFVQTVKTAYPEYFLGTRVLDIGSLDINGNNRQFFTNCDYTGIDIGEGANVDIVARGHEFISDEPFDVVISTECFEHDEYWRETFFAVVNRHLKSGGLFVFTCATTGRPEHGTRRTSPQDAPFVGDYYCNLTEKDYRGLVNFDTIFRAYGFKSQTWPADLYFWGIKH